MNILIAMGLLMLAYTIVSMIVDPDRPDPDEYIWDEE